MSQDNRTSADYQRDVSDFVRNNVLCCVSSLVSDVYKLVGSADRDTLRQTSFDEDDLRKLMECEDWETPGREHVNSMDRDELDTALGELDVTDDRDEEELEAAMPAAYQIALDEHKERWPNSLLTVEDFVGDDILWPGFTEDQLREKLILAIEEQADGWKDFCNEQSIDPEYIEVYEHWAVDSWFGRKLAEHGETVEDFGNLTVWGRCTTGQSISMDYVVCQIYDELHEHHQEQSA